MDIGIVGSCVTRDAIELIKEKVTIEYYIARSSLISIFCESALHVEGDGLRIPGKGAFENRMLQQDVFKNSADLIFSSKADAVFLDFIDERFEIIAVEGSFVTKSNYLMATQFGKSLQEVKVCKPGTPYVESLWYQAADKLIRSLDGRRIFLHEAYWAECYRDHSDGEIRGFSNEQLKLVRHNNNILRKYYDYIKLKLPSVILLKAPAELVFSDFASRWGVDYFHYGQEYYHAIAKKIAYHLSL